MASVRVYLLDVATDPSILAIIIAVNVVVGVIWLFLFTLITCKEGIIKKLLVAFVLVAVMGLAELCAFTFFSIARGDTIELSFDSFGFLGPLVALVFQMAFYSLLMVFRKLWKLESKEDFVSFGLFLLMPISQILLVLGAMTISIQHGYSFSMYIFTGVMVGFVANLVLLRILFTNSEKAALKSRLMKLEQMHELERSRFESIESRQYELAKIRHDFNNQLVTAFRLVEHNKNEEASGMLDALSTALTDTKDKSYCMNHVVNAVLTEKKTACEIADISLDVNIDLVEDCGIEALHLCSVFSNLLDNAINACLNIPHSVITISALQKGDYLHIKCINPAPADRNTKPGNGYGTRILSDIAEHYDGAFNVEEQNGLYYAVISLMCAT